MHHLERAAVKYLMPPVYSFWSWSDGGETIEWRDGKTIAFRVELEAVFCRLERESLPPLGAILLLLAAARDSWHDGSSEMGILSGLLELLSGHEDIATPTQAPARKTWATDLVLDAFCTLDRVCKLPAELRHSPQSKAEIVALVCDGIGRRDHSALADDVLMALEKRQHVAMEGSALGELSKRLAPITIQSGLAAKESLQFLRNSLHFLCQDAQQLDAEQLRLRLETGLNELPAPALLELTPAEQTWALINSLQNDVELGGVARLARNLVAAVHLPRPIAEFDEMPLGGVSDISNRGTLDRLLLSELAHDDLTLSVRVAMNEALYLRRESPPRSPPRERFVLLDAGLRTWGVPRVFATAIALALAATSDPQIETQVYRSTDKDVAAVDFTSRAGLVAHLGELATVAHPAAAVTALIERGDASALSDTILVTTADTLADPEFARALARLDLPVLHVATVDRSGVFRLLLLSRQGRKTLREARFALDELLTPNRSRPLVDRELQRGQPAIFSVQPFPLLLVHQFELERTWSVVEYGALSMTRDGRLLHWTAPKQGGKQIAVDLPFGGLHWAADEVDRNGLVRAVVGRLSQRGLRLLLVDLENGTCASHVLMLDGDMPQAVTAYQGVVYVIFNDHVEAFDATSAEKYGLLSTGSREWVRGRFFRRRPASQWFALALDGVRPTFEPLPASLSAGGELLTVFDCPGAVGPLAVSSKGVISPYHASHPPLQVFDNPILGVDVLAISRDGKRVALQEKQPPKVEGGLVVNVVTRIRSPLSGNPQDAVEVDLRRLVRPRPVRHRFHSIAALSDGTLALSTGKRGWWRLSVSDTANSLYLRHVQLYPPNGAVQPFEDVTATADVGYALRCATWSDGSTAFLDSRGLLHLRSSDLAIPEATIVLAEGQMAGWVSDGRCWGGEYFFPSNSPRLSEREFCEQVLKPFASRIPC